MGWSLIDAAVEVKREKTRPRTFLQPRGLFGFVPPQWKVFLLGHTKYGEKECWEPEKPIRGIPERAMRSDWTWNYMEKYEDASEDELSKNFTYYTLKELEQIDLSEPVGLPDNSENKDKYRRCLSLELKKNGEWYSKGKLHSCTLDQIQKALEAENPIEIKNKNSGKKEEIRVERRKKSFYARGFTELLDTINTIYENKAFKFKHANYQEVTKEDIRLMVGAGAS